MWVDLSGNRLMIARRARSLRAGAQHFVAHCCVERAPGVSQLRSECRAELLLEAPDQCFAEGGILRRLDPELGMLLARVRDEGLEQLALVERADEGREHVHQ